MSDRDRDRDTPYSVFKYPMDQIGVGAYEKHLIGMYSIDDRSYGHMKDVLVPVITHYKDDVQLEHEYTMAMVKEGDEGCHLKIE
jgi:energy-converting hydrogenase Eha subunit A